jgi:hypothetical protein
MWWRAVAAIALLLAGGCASVSPSSSNSTKGTDVPVAAPTAPRVLSAADAPREGPCIQTTHGCVALNPDVTQGTVKRTICVPGYTKSVRPATSYTNGIKVKLLTEAGIDQSRIGDFELDHIVPLALGGHPRKLSNLVLQPWEGEHGAKRKDSLEARMHSLVCHGEVGLTEAQACIAEDWELCAAKYKRH